MILPGHPELPGVPGGLVPFALIVVRMGFFIPSGVSDLPESTAKSAAADGQHDDAQQQHCDAKTEQQNMAELRHGVNELLPGSGSGVASETVEQAQ